MRKPLAVIIIMKKILGYLKVFVLVFISIVMLYYLEFLFHGKLHLIIARKLLSMFPHWYFYESLFFIIFDFIFALIGFLLFKYYKRTKHYSEDLLFIFSIPALFPIFLIGVSLISRFFINPCFTPQYFIIENIISWIGRIIYWLYAIFFSLYVLFNLSKRYVLVFLFEYFVFLAYLSMFYAKLIGPIKLPFHIFW
jgi:hypothetical protein